MIVKGFLKSDIYLIILVKLCLLYKMCLCRKGYEKKFKIICIFIIKEKYVNIFVYFFLIVFGCYFFIVKVTLYLYDCFLFVLFDFIVYF